MLIQVGKTPLAWTCEKGKFYESQLEVAMAFIYSGAHIFAKAYVSPNIV